MIKYVYELMCRYSLSVEFELPKLVRWVRLPLPTPYVKIVGTTDVEIKLNSKELSFFVSKKGCDDMLNIIKEKLDLCPDLKKKIDWTKNYASTSITLEKGHLIRLEPSNLAYVDPHKVKINNYTFLFFNDINTFYVNNLNEQHNLSELGLSQVPVEFISNGKSVILNVSYPLKESQVKDYMKEFKDIKDVKLHIHPTFNYSFEDLPNEIVFDLDKNDKVLKLIPIIKDIDNLENISNKFKLGIITSTIETIKNSHDFDHN